MSLSANALTRVDDWLLCGADIASMKFGYDRRKRDHLVSLGGLLADIGHRPVLDLKGNHRKAWLDDLMHSLAMGLL